MTWHSRIVSDPGILLGKPTIKGTRIAVALILDVLASGWSMEDILASYPQITREDVLAALDFAAEMYKEQTPAARSKALQAEACSAVPGESPAFGNETVLWSQTLVPTGRMITLEMPEALVGRPVEVVLIPADLSHDRETRRRQRQAFFEQFQADAGRLKDDRDGWHDR
jgi:uncharacterized protein (DUF433 family)